jgi:ATP-dependent Lon protease
MPASRWNKGILDMLDWMFDDDDEDLEELYMMPIVPTVVKDDVSSEPDAQMPDDEHDEQIPSVLPVLPLRGLVVYPQTAVPLTIGQPRSVRLVDDVMASDERLIALVASRNPELEEPNPEDLFNVGTIGIVHRLFRAPDDTIRLVVQGLMRFRMGAFVQDEPYLKAHIELNPETIEEDLELEALARNARDQFEHIAEMIPSIPRELVASVVTLEDPLQTVYTIANFQRMDLDDAQGLLELDSATEKLHKLVSILVREAD